MQVGRLFNLSEVNFEIGFFFSDFTWLYCLTRYEELIVISILPAVVANA
jgi:hypothetical protein